MSPALQYVAEVAHDVACGDMDTPLALASLRAHGYTADPDALADAVQHLRDLAGIRGGSVHPRDWLGGSLAASVDAYAEAERLLEDRLGEALRVLVRPAERAA